MHQGGLPRRVCLEGGLHPGDLPEGLHPGEGSASRGVRIKGSSTELHTYVKTLPSPKLRLRAVINSFHETLNFL